MAKETLPQTKPELPKLQAARDIAVQALAANADPSDAREVLDYALNQLGYQLNALQRACLDGFEPDKVDVALIVLQERVEALGKFAELFIDVRFRSVEAEP